MWDKPPTISFDDLLQTGILRTGLSYLATISGGFRYQDIYNQHVTLTAPGLFAISTSSKYIEIKILAFSLQVEQNAGLPTRRLMLK